MKWKVLISCIHLQRMIDRYKPIFEEREIDIDLPEVVQQLNENDLLKMICFAIQPAPRQMPFTAGHCPARRHGSSNGMTDMASSLQMEGNGSCPVRLLTMADRRSCRVHQCAPCGVRSGPIFWRRKMQVQRRGKGCALD